MVSKVPDLAEALARRNIAVHGSIPCHERGVSPRRGYLACLFTSLFSSPCGISKGGGGLFVAFDRKAQERIGYD
jgi:hypothetical protein